MSAAPAPATPRDRSTDTGPSLTTFLCFSQDAHRYLVPATALIAVVAATHLRPWPQPVAGWAGTIETPGGLVPVLDAAALLGHGGRPQSLLLLHVASGPLALAIEQVDGMITVETGLTSPADPGVTAVVQDGRVLLICELAHLDALRRAAIGSPTDGPGAPRPISWEAPGATTLPARADRRLVLPGTPVVILAEAADADGQWNLAVSADTVMAVGWTGALRPAPPGLGALVGYRAWGQRALLVIDPRRLSGSVAVEPPPRALPYLLALRCGIGLLTARVRGVQALTRVEHLGPTDPGWLLARGEVPGYRPAGGSAPAGLGVAVVDPEWLGTRPAA